MWYVFEMNLYIQGEHSEQTRTTGLAGKEDSDVRGVGRRSTQ